MSKEIVDIDDSYSSQSKLLLETVPTLQSIMFTPKLQQGFCDSFSLHLVDIDDVINFLIKSKEELCQQK